MILTDHLSEIFSAWSVLVSSLYVHTPSHEKCMHVSGMKTNTTCASAWADEKFCTLQVIAESCMPLCLCWQNLTSDESEAKTLPGLTNVHRG